MVRLKEEREFNHYRNYHISIPYGAIKSALSIRLLTLPAIFQFLMVRLKASLYKQV